MTTVPVPPLHSLTRERLAELQAESTRLIETVRRLAERQLDFDDDPTSYVAALRKRQDMGRHD